MGFMNVLRMKPFADLDARLQRLFGRNDDEMPDLETRARALFGTEPVIVWQCDHATFRFSYVSPSAEQLLGYPVQRWIDERAFWADCIVHPDDREDTVSYCALATQKGCDHEFEYRAIAADGRTVWLRDVVRVVRDAKGAVCGLRGAMFDVTAEKQSLGAAAGRPTDFIPTRDELLAKAS